MKIYSKIMTAITVFLVCSCSDNSGIEVEPTFDNDEIKMISGLNGFAFDLCQYAMTLDAGHSIVLSPASLSVSLGVEANCQAENSDAIVTLLGQNTLLQTNELLKKVIEKYIYPAKNVTKSFATAMFNNGESAVDNSTMSILRGYYRAEIYTCDFSSPSQVSDKIVDWVKIRTNGLIDFQEVPVDESMTAIHASAIYFKGKWANKFDAAKTSAETFYMEDRSTKSVQMMSTAYNGMYAEIDGTQAVSLPYGDGEYNMSVVMTADNGALDLDLWELIVKQMQVKTISVSLPKFESEFKKQLSLGNFVDCPLLHAAKITVDEEGSEAAGGTVIGDTFNPSSPVEFKADRPFYYLITDSTTGMILFIGHYNG